LTGHQQQVAAGSILQEEATAMKQMLTFLAVHPDKKKKRQKLRNLL
jgi:hypothetical protein